MRCSGKFQRTSFIKSTFLFVNLRIFAVTDCLALWRFFPGAPRCPRSRAGRSAGACWRCCWLLQPRGWMSFTRVLFRPAGRRCATCFLTSQALCFFSWPSPCGWAGEKTAPPSDKFCTPFSPGIQQLWFAAPHLTLCHFLEDGNENRASVQGVLPDHY